MNDTTEKRAFSDFQVDTNLFHTMLRMLSDHGVKHFECAQFSVQFFEYDDSPAVTTEPEKHDTKNDDDVMLFSAVGG